MAAKRPAQLVAVTVEVRCPYCGEPYLAPDSDAEGWRPEDLFKHEGRKQCGSCDEEFHLFTQPHARIER